MPILPDIPSLSEARYHLVCCLENSQIRIFNQLMFSALLLLQFLNTTETLSIKVDHGHLDWQLSSVE